MNNGPTLAADGTIYFSWGSNNLEAVNPDGSEKWKFMSFSGQFSAPSVGSDGTDQFQAQTTTASTLSIRMHAKVEILGWRELQFISGDRRHGTIHVGSASPEEGSLFALNPDGSLKWALQGPAIWRRRQP